MTILTPLIVYFIALYLERPRDVGYSIFWILITPLIRYLRSFFDAHSTFNLTLLGSDVANSIALGMVKKSLSYSVLCNKRFKMGEISNLMQVDCFRMSLFPKNFSAVIYITYVLIFGIVFMALLVGPAFLAGVGVILLASTINMLVSRFTSRYQK